jgi:hypothetical protein
MNRLCFEIVEGIMLDALIAWCFFWTRMTRITQIFADFI